MSGSRGHPSCIRWANGTCSWFVPAAASARPAAAQARTLTRPICRYGHIIHAEARVHVQSANTKRVVFHAR